MTFTLGLSLLEAPAGDMGVSNEPRCNVPVRVAPNEPLLLLHKPKNTGQSARKVNLCRSSARLWSPRAEGFRVCKSWAKQGAQSRAKASGGVRHSPGAT